MEETKNSKEDKKQEKPKKPQERNWKGWFIGMSIVAGILLIAIVVLATRPPKTEYVYLTSSNNDNWSSSSTDSTSSYNVPVDDSETITYEPGEKTDTSIAGATIEVEKVIKNYQGYKSYSTSCKPEDGYEYVQVKLSFENNTTNAIKMYSFDFYLKDSDGMIDDAESDYCEDGTEALFPFSKEITGGGTKISGAMLFKVRKEYADNLTLLYEKDTPREAIRIAL